MRGQRVVGEEGPVAGLDVLRPLRLGGLYVVALLFVERGVAAIGGHELHGSDADHRVGVLRQVAQVVQGHRNRSRGGFVRAAFDRGGREVDHAEVALGVVAEFGAVHVHGHLAVLGVPSRLFGGRRQELVLVLEDEFDAAAAGVLYIKYAVGQVSVLEVAGDPALDGVVFLQFEVPFGVGLHFAQQTGDGDLLGAFERDVAVHLLDGNRHLEVAADHAEADLPRAFGLVGIVGE